jgi:hypothetical protein
MATEKIPYWAILLEENERAVVLNAVLHVSGSPDNEYADFKKSVPAMSQGIIRFTRAGLIEAEEAIDLWAVEKSPPSNLGKEAHRLCCRLQAIGRCDPSGYNEVELPPAKPVERQIGLFD